jgi:hypothetical protein
VTEPNTRRNSVGFTLCVRARIRNRKRRERTGCASLLDDMRQLVREQALSVSTRGLVLARCENHVRSDSERQRVDRASRLARPRIGMHLHVAEVVAKALFHCLAGLLIERPSTR